jgi:hypothetical protein
MEVLWEDAPKLYIRALLHPSIHSFLTLRFSLSDTNTHNSSLSPPVMCPHSNGYMDMEKFLLQIRFINPNAGPEDPVYKFVVSVSSSSILQFTRVHAQNILTLHFPPPLSSLLALFVDILVLKSTRSLHPISHTNPHMQNQTHDCTFCLLSYSILT